MKKYLSILGFAGLLSGCATTLQSSSAIVSAPAPSAKSAKWSITARDNSHISSDTITIYINGAQAAVGTITPSQHAGVVTGSYQQHAILGDCTLEDAPAESWASWGPYQCIIYVDGIKVAILKF